MSDPVTLDVTVEEVREHYEAAVAQLKRAWPAPARASLVDYLVATHRDEMLVAAP